jgi:hypothetical protein
MDVGLNCMSSDLDSTFEGRHRVLRIGCFVTSMGYALREPSPMFICSIPGPAGYEIGQRNICILIQLDLRSGICSVISLVFMVVVTLAWPASADEAASRGCFSQATESIVDLCIGPSPTRRCRAVENDRGNLLSSRNVLCTSGRIKRLKP